MFTLPEGPGIKRASDEDHRAIAGALARRDPAAAGNAAAAHVAHTEKWLHAFLPGRPEQAGADAP
nr:FCD domain-containing protein [Streptomyces sp. ME19-01-6]